MRGGNRLLATEDANILGLMQSRPPREVSAFEVTKSLPAKRKDTSVEGSQCSFACSGRALGNLITGDPRHLPGCRSIRRAFVFAERKLDGKIRGRDGEPAVCHSVRVAQILREVFGLHECRLMVVALLHDVIEDSDAGYDDIEAAFGSEIADAVVVLTKPMFYPKPLRKEIYESALIAASEDVLLVKLADLFDNLQSRRGRKRVARTWRAASALLNVFSERRVGPRVRRAIRIVRSLLADLGREEPIVSAFPEERKKAA